MSLRGRLVMRSRRKNLHKRRSALIEARREEWGIQLWREILDIIYPRRCPVCDKIVLPEEGLVCQGCRRKLPYIKEPCCKKCGKQIRREEDEYCGDCRRVRHAYTEGRALFTYDSIMRQSVSAFKYKGRQEYAEWYGEELAKHFGGQLKRWGAEALIPVPVHRARYRKRGYNQAALLAEQISYHTGLEMDENVLVRTKKTVAQKELGTRERGKNLQEAFQLRKNVVQYKKVVLVDDIYTTGSTADACAKVLRQNGVEQIYLLCLCIGDGF